MKAEEVSKRLKVTGAPRYITLSAATINELEVLCVQAVSMGFKPAGGLLHSPTTPGKDNFFQAFYKE